jgi:hypothetical protein
LIPPGRLSRCGKGAEQFVVCSEKYRVDEAEGTEQARHFSNAGNYKSDLSPPLVQLKKIEENLCE